METMVSVGDNCEMMVHLVTIFVRNRGAVLLTRHADSAETDSGRWDGLSAPIRGDASSLVTEARRLARAVVGDATLTLAYAGEQRTVAADGDERTIYPFLFDASSREIDVDTEGAFVAGDENARTDIDAVEWLPPTAMLDRPTVPGLWDAYQQVAPSPTTVAANTAHGSAAVSIHALEVLRDRAAVATDWTDLLAVALELRDARPSMAVLSNRVARVMASADRSTDAVHDRAIDEIAAATDADATAAETAAGRLSGPIATLSWSGTVRDALIGIGDEVLVGESRPDCEGIDFAESLSAAGLDVTVTTDAALGGLLGSQSVQAVLVGADTILPTGSVVNKTGTRALALAAAHSDVPCYVVAARDKVAPDDTFHSESGPTDAIYDGPESLAVENPIFDRTPGDLIDGVLTESGLLDGRDITLIAAQHRSNVEWLASEAEAASEASETSAASTTGEAREPSQ